MGCTRCGKCCKQVVFRVPKVEGSMLFWRLHGIEFYDDKAAGMAVVVLHDKCEWLDGETLRCKNYERRPQMCRDFLCDTARG